MSNILKWLIASVFSLIFPLLINTDLHIALRKFVLACLVSRACRPSNDIYIQEQCSLLQCCWRQQTSLLVYLSVVEVKGHWRDMTLIMMSLLFAVSTLTSHLTMQWPQLLTALSSALTPGQSSSLSLSHLICVCVSLSLCLSVCLYFHINNNNNNNHLY